MDTFNSKRKQTGDDVGRSTRSKRQKNTDSSQSPGDPVGQNANSPQSPVVTGQNNNNQVTYEIQECHDGGENGLGQAYDNCKKNPGHPDFIPVGDFGLEHLPTGYKNKDILNLTKCLDFLTCRLVVRKISEDRPKFYPGSKQPYPCSDRRGQGSFHTGSGWVWEVEKCTEEESRRLGIEHNPCKRLECVDSNQPCKEWWEVEVCTALHVTFDDIEVKSTEVEFFYNDKDRSKVKKLQGGKMVYGGDIEEDRCWFVCYTHDMELVQSLYEIMERYDDLNGKIGNKYKVRIGRPSLEHPLTVIVSHPHGCPKQISVGELKERQEDDIGLSKYKYTTCTCPGSSGAMVWYMGCRDDLRLVSYWHHPHSGSCEGNLNTSGAGWDLLLSSLSCIDVNKQPGFYLFSLFDCDGM